MSQSGEGRTVPRVSISQWFSKGVAENDKFVAPNFSLGQFFYSRETAQRLVSALDHYQNPCCLCTPRLAREWHERGRRVTVLDVDRRFADLPGYSRFDLLKPVAQKEAFDCIVFDPVFVAAPILRRALDFVMKGCDPSAPPDLFVTFPVEREDELLHAFKKFSLRQLGFELRYCNVKDDYQGMFKLYGSREIST